MFDRFGRWTLALNGVGVGLTIRWSHGAIIETVQLTVTIHSVSQQLNFVLMALAGADRIFDLLDGTRKLTGRSRFGQLRISRWSNAITDRKTNLWAWKHPLIATTGGRVGRNVVFQDVDFSYDGRNQSPMQTGAKVAFIGATGAGRRLTITSG